jgi:TRAP-type C4-dicarboxylate transport system permease small subunit
MSFSLGFMGTNIWISAGVPLLALVIGLIWARKSDCCKNSNILYRDWLSKLESSIVLVLLALLIYFGIMSVFGPRFGYRYGVEARENMKLVSFYLCMFGGVLATRRAGHIAVDAITPHLRKELRLRIEGWLMLFAGSVTTYVGLAAVDYVKSPIIPDDLVKWRWQIALIFFWIAFHFVVNGVVRVLGKEMVELGLAHPPIERALEGFEEEPEEEPVEENDEVLA